MKAYIASDSHDTIEELKNQAENIKEQLGQERQESWTLDMIHSEQLDLNRFAAEKTNNVSREEAGEEAYQVQTKTLYGIAKGFLEEMKQMGQAMS